MGYDGRRAWVKSCWFRVEVDVGGGDDRGSRRQLEEEEGKFAMIAVTNSVQLEMVTMVYQRARKRF